MLATTFGLVFVGELPDKTMFAALVLAARGRRGLVWLGAAAAFAVHAAIAVTVGGVLFTLLPTRAVQAMVAALFLGGALFALRVGGQDDDDEVAEDNHRFGGFHTTLTAFVVIFLAEWGDLTQIITANLAARYGAPIVVGIASALALWAVAGLAMFGGRLLGHLPVVTVRRITGVVLLVLAGLTAYSAITGQGTVV